jgi:hypothetical protein
MTDPILMLGGTGVMGTAIARLLRAAHPHLPLLIAARGFGRAKRLADELGNALAIEADVDLPNLGLSASVRFSAVAVLLRDLGYNSIRAAQARGVPIVLISEAAFELAPIAALFASGPSRSAIVMMGHSHGGIPMLLAASRLPEYRNVQAVRVGVVFDPEDPLPPGAQIDMERIAGSGPPPLALRRGRWSWLGVGETAGHVVTTARGDRLEAEAYGLPDILSLADLVPGADITLLGAEGRTARGPDGRPGHEVTIEIDGEDLSGRPSARRWRLIDPEGNARLGARGIALALERLSGITGQRPDPGLYFPEKLISPKDAVERLSLWGMELVEETVS